MKHDKKEKRGNREEKEVDPPYSHGDILVSVIVFAAVAVTVLIGLTNWGVAMLKSLRTVQAREQAFQVAEAGIDYYRWHLAQFPADYKDGTTTPSPYYHQLSDKNGNLIGMYALVITPPPVGSTKVIITSTGSTTGTNAVQRVIQATMAIPSLAQYSVVADDYLRFGAGTNVYGPVTSNYGIRFDGTAYNIISSAQSTYVDPDYNTSLTLAQNIANGNCTQMSFGVHTCVANGSYPSGDSSPPASVPSRPDIFTAGRQFPVPAFDFNGLALNLQQLQTTANTGGYNFSQSKYTSGHNTVNGYGYHMVLSPPNSSYPNGYFTMYVVTAIVSAPSGCGTDPTAQGEMNAGGQQNNGTNWGTWSIQSETLYNLGANSNGIYPFPSNGIIFAQDDLWVDGQINGARLTIAAGILPDPGANGEPNITIGSINSENNGNLLYSHFDGTDTIGLIAQGNINVPLVSADNLIVDGALIAENGRIGRFYYGTSCNVNSMAYYNRNTINLNGMIATNQRYGFAYTDNTGYTNRNITYDGNLLYAPPPSFPLATSQYQMISWQQLQ